VATPDAYWTTAVADVAESNVFIRGYNLAELIGRLPFSAATYLLVRGELPTPAQARVVAAMLCSILDFSLYKPGTAAARYAVSGNPQMTAGIAVAVLSVGEYKLAPEDAGRFIAESHARYVSSGEDFDAAARACVAEIAARRSRIPGLGHPDSSTRTRGLRPSSGWPRRKGRGARSATGMRPYTARSSSSRTSRRCPSTRWG
jgi:citrate synthase